LRRRSFGSSDGLRWPNRDGLKWPTGRRISCRSSMSDRRLARSLLAPGVRKLDRAANRADLKIFMCDPARTRPVESRAISRWRSRVRELPLFSCAASRSKSRKGHSAEPTRSTSFRTAWFAAVATPPASRDNTHDRKRRRAFRTRRVRVRWHCRSVRLRPRLESGRTQCLFRRRHSGRARRHCDVRARGSSATYGSAAAILSTITNRSFRATTCSSSSFSWPGARANRSSC
jgi:hypothetical protein